MDLKRKVGAVVAAVLAGALVGVGGTALVTSAAATSCTSAQNVGKTSPVADDKPMLVAAGATNTGVPAGAVLKPYTGPLAITCCGTVVENVDVPSGLTIRATNGTSSFSTPCVTIRNVRTHGVIDNGYAGQCGSPGPCGPTVIEDTEIAYNNGNGANIFYGGYLALRVNQHGGRTGFMCEGCEIRDSWSHDNWFLAGAHMGGILSNGNYGRPVVLDHNTVICNVAPGSPGIGSGNGGCSADLNFYGDNSAATNIIVTRNFLRASGDFYYCAYTGAFQAKKHYPVGSNIHWASNIFEKGASGQCGDAGPVADWQAGNGNSWCDNTWSDGTKLTAPAESGCTGTPPTTTTSTSSTSTTSTTRATTTTVTVPASTTTLPVPTSTTSTTQPCFRTRHGDLVCQVG